MSATLSIVNNFEIESLGTTKRGKQGSITDAFDEAFDLTVDGKIHRIEGELASGAAVALYDDDDDNPTDFDYMHVWADQDCYLQLIGSGSNVILKLEAKVPFTLSFDSLLAAADTTAISGSEPTLTDIDKVVLQNNSGNAMSYVASFID